MSRLIRAGFALATLAVTLVGAPLVLLRLGTWPLRGVPGVEDLADLPYLVVDDRTVFGLLTVAAWAIWVLFVIALTAETAATIGGRTEARLPLPVMLRRPAAWLIAAVAALGLRSSAPARTPPEPTPAVAVAVAEPPPIAPSPPPPPAAPTLDTATSDPTVVATVAPGDTAWGLAERHLGDGFRWREIWEANRGHDQPGGARWTRPEHIEAGWQLVIPIEPTTGPAPAATPPPAEAPGQSATVTVAEGDHLWGIAEQALTLAWGRPPSDAELDPYWRQLVAANQDRLPPPHDPDLIHPGQHVEMPPPPPPPGAAIPSRPANPDPPAPTPPPSQPPTPAPPPPPPAAGPEPPPDPTVERPSGPNAPTGPVRDQPAAPSAIESEASPPMVGVGVLGVAGTVLAVGVLQTLRLRRRRAVAQGQRDPILAPSDEARAVHGELQRTADEHRVGWLTRVLGHLARSVAESRIGVVPARPRVVQVGPDWVDILLRDPHRQPPVPWQPELSGLVWQWDRATRFVPPEPDPDAWSPLPALVTLGANPDGSSLLLDLEEEGVLGVVGDPRQADGLVRSMVLELASTPLRDSSTTITFVGDAFAGAAGFDEVRSVDSFAGVADELVATARQRRALLDELGQPTALAARGAGRLEVGAPGVVVIGEPPDDDRFAELCAQAGDHRGGVVVICVGWCPPHAVLVDVADGQVRIPDAGLACAAQTIDATTAATIADIVESSAPADQLQLLDLPDQPIPGLTVDGYEDRPYEVLVRLLAGAPSVVAGDRRFTGKQLAVLAYLALRRSVTVDQLRDAVWAGKPVTPKRVLNVVDELRQILGHDLVPEVQRGQVTVAAGITTDADLFDRRLLRAQREPTGAPATLRAALELVAGDPFAFPTAQADSYSWVESERWGSRYQAKITDAAVDLAHLLFEAGDGDGARWAAERGLRVSNADDRLTRLLIRAYGLLDQPEAAVRSAHEYHAVLDQLGVDDVSANGDSVWDLVYQVTGRRPAEASTQGRR